MQYYETGLLTVELKVVFHQFQINRKYGNLDT